MPASLIDKFTWEILTYLHQKGNARYKDIKYDTNLSDSVIASRLNLLKSYKLVRNRSVVTKDKSFFEYRLTPKGIDFAEKLDLHNFMQSLNKIIKNFK